MDYRTIYDIANDWPDVWFPGAGLLFLWAVFRLPVWAGRPLLRGWKKLPDGDQIRAVLMVAFLILWTAGALYTTVVMHLVAQATLRHGTAGVAEGQVSGLGYVGKDHRFFVGGMEFLYSPARVGPGFHGSIWGPAPLHLGEWARVHYTGAGRDVTILRLEVGDGQCHRLPDGPVD